MPDNWLDRSVGKFINRYVKAPSPSAVVISPAGGVTLPIGDEYLAIDDKLEQYEKLALTCSWVYSDINVLGKETSKAQITIQKVNGEDREPVKDHEFERTMRNPNPHMDGMYMRQYTTWWWLLRGEAYWLNIFNKAGDLKHIYPLPSDKIRPIGDRKKYIKGYKYTPRRGHRSIMYRPEQIVYFRFPHPFKYHRGLPPLVAYLTPMMTDLRAARWNMTAYEKGMALQTLIGLRPELSNPQYNKAKAELVEQLVDNQQRYLIARTGDINATTLSLSPREAEYLAGRNLSRDEIDRVFGFPEGYWSMLANRANAEQAKASLIDGVVWPLLEMMCRAITTQIIVPRYGENLICVPEDIRIQDRQAAMAERASRLSSMTYDEGRANIDLEPYNGPFAELIGPLPAPLAVNPSFILALSQQQNEPETPANGEQQVAPKKEPPKGDEGERLPDGDEGERLPDGDEGGQSSTGSDEDEADEEVQAKAIKADLRKWRRIEVGRAVAGEPPGYEFKSDVIPIQLNDIIKAALMTGTPNENYIKATFGAAIDTVGKGGEPSGEFFQSWESYGYGRD